MMQIINITQARKNLAKLLKQVNKTKEPVVIVQDSSPSVVIYPYDDIINKEEIKNQLYKQRFEQIFSEGKKAFKAYLKRKKIKEPITEEEAYDIIKNA